MVLSVILISISSTLTASQSFNPLSLSEPQDPCNEVLLWQRKQPGTGAEKREEEGETLRIPYFQPLRRFNEHLCSNIVFWCILQSGKAEGFLSHRISIWYGYRFILRSLLMHPLMWKKIYQLLNTCHHCNFITVLFDADLVLLTLCHSELPYPPHMVVSGLHFLWENIGLDSLLLKWGKKHTNSSPVSTRSPLTEICYYHPSW